jgi:hypothetical protein
VRHFGTLQENRDRLSCFERLPHPSEIEVVAVPTVIPPDLLLISHSYV